MLYRRWKTTHDEQLREQLVFFFRLQLRIHMSFTGEVLSSSPTTTTTTTTTTSSSATSIATSAYADPASDDSAKRKIKQELSNSKPSSADGTTITSSTTATSTLSTTAYIS